MWLVMIFVFLIILGILYEICLWAEGRVHAAGNFFTQGNRRWFLLGSTLVAILLTCLLFGVFSPLENEKRETRRDSNVYVKEKKYYSILFKFEQGKGFALKLGENWKSYPKGGPVKVKTPSGREVIDYPGVDIPGYQRPGMYEFYPHCSSTTGVEIWNYWDEE